METKGCGILPDFESEEFSKWWAEGSEREEQRRQQEAEEAKQEAAGQKILDRAESMFFPWLKRYLEAENATTRITPKQKIDFKSFQQYCGKWGLIPQIPAAPPNGCNFPSGRNARWRCACLPTIEKYFHGTSGRESR